MSSNNGTVSIRARITVNLPTGRWRHRDIRSISLERAYMVSESEAREATEQWRKANPELGVHAVYTVEL